MQTLKNYTAGMLSKSKGQILRMSTALHVLFHLGTVEDIESEITEIAITAAIKFVTLSCQQALFMAGRGKISQELQIIDASMLLPPMGHKNLRGVRDLNIKINVRN